MKPKERPTTEPRKITYKYEDYRQTIILKQAIKIKPIIKTFRYNRTGAVIRRLTKQAKKMERVIINLGKALECEEKYTKPSGAETAEVEDWTVKRKYGILRLYER